MVGVDSSESKETVSPSYPQRGGEPRLVLTLLPWLQYLLLCFPLPLPILALRYDILDWWRLRWRPCSLLLHRHRELARRERRAGHRRLGESERRGSRLHPWWELLGCARERRSRTWRRLIRRQTGGLVACGVLLQELLLLLMQSYLGEGLLERVDDGVIRLSQATMSAAKSKRVQPLPRRANEPGRSRQLERRVGFLLHLLGIPMPKRCYARVLGSIGPVERTSATTLAPRPLHLHPTNLDESAALHNDWKFR